MAPRTRKATAKRRLNHVSRDEDETGEQQQQQNEQQPDMEVSQQSIQKQVTGHRTRKATGNLSGCRSLLDKNQMEGVGQDQNEELEFQTIQQTNGRTAPRTQRSTLKRINHGLLDENEMEEHGRQENEQHPNLEVAEALQNALNILMSSSTQRATTHGGFQDKHQREENWQQQSRRQPQPSMSQKVSMRTPTIRKATRSHLGYQYHRLHDESQMEGNGQHQTDEQPEFQMTPQVMAPNTRRSMVNRKLNHVLLDEDEIEEHEQFENEQQPDLEFTQKIADALKILMVPSSRRATTNVNSNHGFRDKHQMKENGQLQNRQQLQPQISHQASMMAPRPRKATTNQSGYHRLRGQDQMERDRQNQNEEQPEFQSTRQTKGQRVMTPSTRRSKVNHGLQDEDEIEEHAQQENEQESDLEVTQAIENALKILMDPSTQRATTNVNSPCGLQDKHQGKENMQQQSRQQQRPLVSQQASISTVMPPITQNTTRSQREYHRLQDEEDPLDGDGQLQNEEPPEVPITQQTNDKKGTIKRKRGPTLLRQVWGRNSNEERIKVDFNKRGQPVGPNKKTFVGFLGTIARNGKYAPLDIDDWRKVPKENKDEMIKLVKERFEVPEGAEHWILLSIGKKRNSWKSRVKTQCFAPAVSVENQALKPPARVNDEQWNNLLSYWDNEDVMEVCEKNRAHGQKSVMYHTTGKMSYAEIEEELRGRLGRSPTRVEMFAACFTHRDGNPSTHEVGVALARMKEYQSKLPDVSQDPVGPNDSFAKVIGNDPPGKVRMLGLGVNKTDVWGGIPSLSTCYRLVLENQSAVTRLEEKMDQFTKLIGSLQEKIEPQQNPNNVRTTRAPTSPGQSSNSNIVGHKLQVGDSVLLKSLFDQNKIVAKGCLESTSPDQYVGGRRLGSNWCAVQISVPMEWDEDLIRPYSNYSTIGDAIGNCVSWPRHLVINEDNQQ